MTMSDGGSFQQQCRDLTAAPVGEPAPDRLQRLFDLAWDRRMENFPEMATMNGYPRYQDRWTDWSFDAIHRRKQETGLLKEVLDTIERDDLNTTERLSYDLFAAELADETEAAHYPLELMPLNQMEGVQQTPAWTLEMMPLATAAQRADFLCRLERLPALVEQTMALMEEGMERGFTAPRVALADVPGQILNQIPDSPASAPVLVALQNLPDSVSKGDREAFVSRAQALYREQVVPAYRSLHDFVVTTYLPRCRESVAWADLSGGEDWYRFLVRQNTTTSMSPDDVFETGLAEVARIRNEMDLVIEQSGFKGDFQAFCEFLRTDPQFFFETPDQLLSAYRDIAKRVDPELIRQFGVLPRLPYGVTPIPSYAEKSQTTAYYQPGSPSAGRPGYFFANTYDLKSRPKWEMEALTLHEAVPGHHLQIALAQELEGIPEFRRQAWITAYGEGWALYSESLGEQMGFYRDPYARFGQLTYEMWRAIRLVVDPGLHAKGWTRQHAIDFFKQNSSKTEHDIAVEIDRYIVWPGQAVSYKIGELKVRQLRVYAEKELGEEFDVRAFHDELLGYGCVPLRMLELIIHDWVARQ